MMPEFETGLEPVEEALGVVNGLIGGEAPAPAPMIELPEIKKAEEPKNIIPATLELGQVDLVLLFPKLDEINKAMAGRLESDIPLNDDYWKLKEALRA